MICFKEGDQTLEGKLLFKRLETTDKEKDVSIDQEQMKQIGKIVVEFWRGTVGESRSDVPRRFCKPSLGVIHERTKNATDATQVSVTQEGAEFDTHDTTAHQVFTFNYRTKPVLQMMSIIQDPPSKPLEKKTSTPKDKDEKPSIDVIELSASEDETDGMARESRVSLKRRIKFLEAELQQRGKKRKLDDITEPVDLTVDSDEE